MLNAALKSGDRHAPEHGRPGLVALLKGLPPEQRPQRVRGDCAFGNEGDMTALEELGQPYLFKLRQSVGVKKLIKQQWQPDDWSPVGQGWQACEAELHFIDENQPVKRWAYVVLVCLTKPRAEQRGCQHRRAN